MTRRLLLLMATVVSPSKIPVDESSLNAFASQFNAYIMQLQNGVVDTKQWERVVRAWRRMTDV